MSTGSSISAHTRGGGVEREVAAELPAPPSPLRASSSGVWMAPAATTTCAARRLAAGRRRSCGLDAAPDAARAVTPGVGVGGARAGVRACGRYDTPTCCFAFAGQPNAHTPEPTQPRTLRRTKSPDQPSASAPRLATCALRAGELRRHRHDVERLLDAREVRRERLGREVLEPELVAPASEHVVGRAEAGAGVDERRPADRLARAGAGSAAARSSRAARRRGRAWGACRAGGR